VTNSTFVDNSAGSDGGAIRSYHGGTLTVTNGTFSGNRAINGSGGAIENDDSTQTITNSTFSGNSANNGGAIFSDGTLTVINSTFVDNSASAGGGGGGISNQGALTLTNSTFSGNSAGVGGGIYHGGGSESLKGVVLAASTGSNCSAAAGTPAFTDAGYNISDDSSCGFAKTGSAGNGDNINPLLVAGGLANNGGPTKTIALQMDSPAIGAIPLASCTYPSGSLNPCTNPPAVTMSDQLTCDQRGYGRPGPDGNCSIGAFEYGASSATPTPTATPTGTPTPTPTATPTPAPVVKLSPPTVQFSNREHDETVVVENGGPGMLRFGQAQISGPDFAIERNGCTAPLAPEKSCSITISFNHADPYEYYGPSEYLGQLTINDNGQGSPQTVSLEGQGHEWPPFF
jgi:predicted outer membrane repeat protein